MADHAKCAGQTNVQQQTTVYDELVCHFPYAVFSVALSLIILSFVTFFGIDKPAELIHGLWLQLFHNFHFIHIIFATAGCLVTFMRFSQDLLKGVLVSIASATVFCILADIGLPYLGARLLGVNMQLHICFINELHNILPFLLIGALTGLAMTRHHQEDAGKEVGLWSHFAHILISSLAASFYIVSHGFHNWAAQIGLVFIVLVGAVVIPCTLSDVVVPMFLAAKPTKAPKQHE
ncbi:MAG TPA: hypothetical protein VJJ83_00035 [Candidatus Babeliales bacterium]|nr:hypothetical protein [Candidatus Babeliales bacterium]